MIREILKDAETRMKKSVVATSHELARIRTGRASTALLDHIQVDYYGNKTPLNQASTVAVGDARTLTITPWERSMIPTIERAIMESDLGLNPVTAGEVIRIPLPPMTEERRLEMKKLVHHEGENGKVAIRNIRRDAIHHVRELLKEKEITQDDERDAEQEAQKLTDSYTAQIDEVVSAKEAEVMEV